MREILCTHTISQPFDSLIFIRCAPLIIFHNTSSAYIKQWCGWNTLYFIFPFYLVMIRQITLIPVVEGPEIERVGARLGRVMTQSKKRLQTTNLVLQIHLKLDVAGKTNRRWLRQLRFRFHRMKFCMDILASYARHLRRRRRRRGEYVGRPLRPPPGEVELGFVATDLSGGVVVGHGGFLGCGVRPQPHPDSF